MARSKPRNHTARWWAQNVIVPIIGGGGAVTLLVAILNPTPKTTIPPERPPDKKVYDERDLLLVAGPDTSYADPDGRRLVGLPAHGEGASHDWGSASVVRMTVPYGMKIVEPILLVENEQQKGSLSDFMVSAKPHDGTNDYIWIGGYSTKQGKSLRVGIRITFSTKAL